MTCPPEELILRFISNAVSREERLRVVRHMVMCRECRELTAMIARFWRLSETTAD